MKSIAIVKRLLEADEDVDPKTYVHDLPDPCVMSFNVTLTFDEPIRDSSSIEEIMANIHEALYLQIQGNGLAPDAEPAVTKRIQVAAIKPACSVVIDDDFS